MSLVHIFVTLKIPDNTARSALYTIQHRLGFPSVKSLRRSEYWQLSFPSLSEEDSIQTMETLAQKTAYFVNPNKHRWVIETISQDASKIASPFESDASILVNDKIDGKAESTLQALRELLEPDHRPQSLQRGIFWDLQFQKVQQPEIQTTVESLAVSKSRKEGFFANPHYQTSRIYYPQ